MSFDYINALLKKPVSRTPIWIMRQAGRYLPEYRATRKKAGNFLNLCKTPELACEVTLQPIDRFDLDAAILFSDILTIPDAMGLGLYFVEGEGPKFKTAINSATQINNLTKPDMSSLSYVFDAVTLVKNSLNNRVPLIGFSGSPWTLATYMLEGGASKTFIKVKGLMYENPKLMHKLLTIISDAVIDYLNEQIASGVDSVMVFDTWGGLLNKEHYNDFSLQYMQKIVLGINRKPNSGKYIPITLFTKGGGAYLEQIASTTCDAIGLDWNIELADAQKRIGDSVSLQGNLDPCVLYASPQTITLEAQKILQQFKGNTGHIFNLGHGISPDVNPDNVKVLIDAVHNI